ncbi:MAG: hypothetical protein WAN66_24095 [Limnoraphis robusta]|uniref:Uncharacterized protein n=1 Tax=Limnoraphis robusta CS-951 TaxID=1637645 RepID=A0A0F5YHC6_9CYAN|nr:hypothetical protein [Limnoraphis robusta]KKD38319.1 hypothetical protein WN50_09495 [Limnoraphis robusta CS-951]
MANDRQAWQNPIKGSLGLISLMAIASVLSMISPTTAQYRPDRPTFFSDGDRKLDQEIQRLDHPSKQQQEPILRFEQAQNPGQPLTQLPGNVIVAMPGASPSERREILDTLGGKLEFTVLATRQSNSQFTVAYSLPLTSTRLGEPQTLFNQIRDSYIKGRPVQLVGERNISLQRYPGREVNLSSSRGTHQFRLYLVQQRVYILGVSKAKDGGAATPDISQFFNSFQLRS